MDDAESLPPILAFLQNIGIPVDAVPLSADGFLPAVEVSGGCLLYDPDRLQWPGDLLHEAGHIAVTDPAIRATVCEFASDGGDEMAAIAWSYAAALAAGVDPRVVFHDHGYRGDGQWLAETFATGGYIGLPMLRYYGLARFPHEEGEQYPAMIKWLR